MKECSVRRTYRLWLTVQSEHSRERAGLVSKVAAIAAVEISFFDAGGCPQILQSQINAYGGAVSRCWPVPARTGRGQAVIRMAAQLD